MPKSCSICAVCRLLIAFRSTSCRRIINGRLSVSIGELFCNARQYCSKVRKLYPFFCKVQRSWRYILSVKCQLEFLMYKIFQLSLHQSLHRPAPLPWGFIVVLICVASNHWNLFKEAELFSFYFFLYAFFPSRNTLVPGVDIVCYSAWSKHSTPM